MLKVFKKNKNTESTESVEETPVVEKPQADGITPTYKFIKEDADISLEEKPTESPSHKEDKETIEQCVDMGIDIKNDVEKSSKAFFTSNNQLKASAYEKFKSYLITLEDKEVRRIKELKYLEFKDKEGQITTLLRNGFAQSLTKGASLDDETKKVVDLVFADIKKYPSKGHRYWYFKEFLWNLRDS